MTTSASASESYLPLAPERHAFLMELFRRSEETLAQIAKSDSFPMSSGNRLITCCLALREHGQPCEVAGQHIRIGKGGSTGQWAHGLLVEGGLVGINGHQGWDDIALSSLQGSAEHPPRWVWKFDGPYEIQVMKEYLDSCLPTVSRDIRQAATQLSAWLSEQSLETHTQPTLAPGRRGARL